MKPGAREGPWADAGAHFQQHAGEAHRTLLWRTWDPDKPAVAFVMLNPSVADADATVRRCVGFAKDWNEYGRLNVVNLFTLVSTQPAGLWKVPLFDRNVPEADAFIARAVQASAITVVAWGSEARSRNVDRARAVKKILRDLFGRERTYCLGLNQDGQPKHPLYLPYTTKLEAF